MQKTVTTVWMALALPFLHNGGQMAPMKTTVPSAVHSAPNAVSGNLAERAAAFLKPEIPLLFQILLTPPPDLRSTWPDLEEARRAEELFSEQQ